MTKFKPGDVVAYFDSDGEQMGVAFISAGYLGIDLEFGDHTWNGEWHTGAPGIWERDRCVLITDQTEIDRIWADYCAWQLLGTDE